MQMAKKKHIIEFPAGRGGYWYLFWLGKVRYNNKQRKIDFYFYNKMTLDESFINNIDYNNWVVKSLPISYLSEYGIGSVYDIMNEKPLTLPYDNSYQINIEDVFRMTKNEFPLNGNKFFIQNSESK
jgi:hypothetical protein